LRQEECQLPLPGDFSCVFSFGARFSYMIAVVLPDGTRIPALGQGTWHMGESKRERVNEVAALRLGIELGMSLIDTAEMYGEGGAEEVVSEAIDGQHSDVFVVTKVYPHNASRENCLKHVSVA
jgi:diketogulonate reductase-like aldo/keto reductase